MGVKLVSTKSRRTKRALDWWESARFQAVFCAWAFFRLISFVYARPPASNASR
jgi:hypothetical protein